MERRLTAILAADVVGYSRLMGEDEVGTLTRLQTCRRELVDPAVSEFHGRIVKLMGDGALIEFASIVDAVQSAVAIQRRMADHDPGRPEAQRIRFRVGVNLGDVIVDGDDLYGDGVNVATRLEAIAEPGGICISGTAFDHVLHKVDVSFASLGERRLKNISDPVRAYRVLIDSSKTARPVARSYRPSIRTVILAGLGAALIALPAALFEWPKPAIQQRPSVAVLPFANLSGDPSQDYFSDGVTDDLITDLTKLSGLDVIARNSVFAYKGQPIVLGDVARKLGVRFIVQGSVRRSGEQIRLNAQLIDTGTGGNLWADRFDRSSAGVFDVQDEMSREIAKALGVQTSATERERIARPPTANLEAYNSYLRAEQAARAGRRDRLREALPLYDKAEALDPTFAEAFAADARTTVYIWRLNFNDIIQSAPARKRAYEKASRALELDQDLSSPYAILGIMQVVDGRYEEAIASAKRAVAIGPGDAEARIALGYVELFAGNHNEAAAAVEAALRFDPNLAALDREVAGLVFLLQGDTARAIETLQRTCSDAPEVGDFRMTLAAAYDRAGRLQDAQRTVAEGLRLMAASDSFNARSLAAWRIGLTHFRNGGDLTTIIDALRQAGLPEWPFGFTADERDQLKGAELTSLVLGHALEGELDPGHQPAILQIGRDGMSAFRSTTRMLTEMVYVNGDELCEQSENMFGRPDCGPVYKQVGAVGQPSYTYVNSSKVFRFSQIQ